MWLARNINKSNLFLGRIQQSFETFLLCITRKEEVGKRGEDGGLQK